MECRRTAVIFLVSQGRRKVTRMISGLAKKRIKFRGGASVLGLVRPRGRIIPDRKKFSFLRGGGWVLGHRYSFFRGAHEAGGCMSPAAPVIKLELKVLQRPHLYFQALRSDAEFGSDVRLGQEEGGARVLQLVSQIPCLSNM